jgi:multiple sugar transport system substrate-binding protein
VPQQEEDNDRDDIETTHAAESKRRVRMHRTLGRIAVLLSILALLFGACSTPAATSAPSGSAVASTPAESVDPSATPVPTPLPVTASEAKPGDVVIRWYCCLGTGDQPEQVKVELKVADDFNASHPGIHLQFEGYIYAAARDALAVQLGSGNAPDIVGPLGIGGAEAFRGQWLDLQPHIEKNNIDMSQYPESTVHLYNVGGDGQLGIPYAVYPSVLFYKAAMFKEAGLAEPPHEWNSEYTMPDGSKRPWDYDTVREIAKLLTVDENGKDATEDGFDPNKIVQWGFEPQRDDLRQTGAYWGAGSFMASDGKTAQMPEPWVAAWKHFYNGIHTDHFSMTGSQFENTDLNPEGYPFCAGKAAMSTNYLWSTYCISGAGEDWNMAATPAYKGKTTAAFNADTWRIMKASKHPDEAFQVLLYLLENKELLELYGATPAIESQQDAHLEAAFSEFKQGIDWKVAKEGIAFADVPNFEAYMPAYNQTLDLINTYGTKWQTTQGLDLDAEIEAMRKEMQAVWDAGGS